MDKLAICGGLVITRRPGESFTVGDSKITVMPGRGSRVRILVNAPKDVKVLRSELLDAGPTAENGGAQ